MTKPQPTKVAWVTTADATQVSVRDGGPAGAPKTQEVFSTSAGGSAAPEAEEAPVVEEELVEEEVLVDEEDVDEDEIPF